MPRISRVVAIGYPYHITQRGNYRQDVFYTDENRSRYLQWLVKYSQKYKLKIWAYCLMSNHVHFVCVPLKEDSLARTFNILHMRYSQYSNGKRNTVGHLWQGRFYSCLLDETHLYEAIRYVENNPVRARLVDEPQEYPWSSAKCHVRNCTDPVVSNDCHLVGELSNWLGYLNEKANKMAIDSIKQNTRSGRPCGTKSFIKKMEEVVGRSLAPPLIGRPRKNQNI